MHYVIKEYKTTHEDIKHPIKITIEVEWDDTNPIDWFDNEDDGVIEWINNQIEEDNIFAWCVVGVTAEIDDEKIDLKGYSSLCGCSYEDKDELLNHCYMPELIDDAIKDLIGNIDYTGNFLKSNYL